MEQSVSEDKKFCSICGNDAHIRRRNRRKEWYMTYLKHHQNKSPICSNCWFKLYRNPKVYHYKGKQFVDKERRLTGYCSRCSKNIYDGSSKGMSMHHQVYIIIFPWFGREELCNSCHAQHHWDENTGVARRVYKRI